MVILSGSNEEGKMDMLRRLRRSDYSRTVSHAIEVADSPLPLNGAQRRRIDRRCGRVILWARDCYRFFKAGPRPRPDRAGS
jgi:hypothetical protein